MIISPLPPATNSSRSVIGTADRNNRRSGRGGGGEVGSFCAVGGVPEKRTEAVGPRGGGEGVGFTRGRQSQTIERGGRGQVIPKIMVEAAQGRTEEEQQLASRKTACTRDLCACCLLVAVFFEMIYKVRLFSNSPHRRDFLFESGFYST